MSDSIHDITPIYDYENSYEAKNRRAISSFFTFLMYLKHQDVTMSIVRQGSKGTSIFFKCDWDEYAERIIYR